jgi:hypothetical protein
MILSSNVQNALLNRPTDFFHCIKIVDKDNVVWKSKTTLWHEVTIGSVLYTPDSIVQIDNPKMNTTVDREQFRFVLSDPNFYDGAVVQSSLIGYRAEVRICFLHYTTKMPLTNLEDTILIYSGRVESVGYQVKTEERGEVLLGITCASPMSDLDLKKSIYLSRDYIRGRNPDDSSCDMIYGGSGILQIKWGKK